MGRRDRERRRGCLPAVSRESPRALSGIFGLPSRSLSDLTGCGDRISVYSFPEGSVQVGDGDAGGRSGDVMEAQGLGHAAKLLPGREEELLSRKKYFLVGSLNHIISG